MTYDERVLQAEHQVRMDEAYWQGLISARQFPKAIPYSTDKRVQTSFEVGFEDGKSAIIMDLIERKEREDERQGRND